MAERGWRVLIVGCGELGSRHLQAVAALPQVHAIDVVDPRPEALANGQTRLAQVAPGNGSLSVRWHTTLDEAARGGDLCIVATQAAGRGRLVQQVASRCGYTRFLLEKIVAQSLDDYDALAAYCAEQALSVWVNLQTRTYPFHQRVKRHLDPEEPVLLSVVGGNWGLANNGVHDADLFAFYDDADRIELAGAQIDPVLHPSKRGADLFDLSGTLIGTTAKGSRFLLSYAGDHTQSEQFTIAGRRYRAIVDHIHRWAVESTADTDWAWRPVPFDDRILVSQMTTTFAREIMTTGRCGLPTLSVSRVAHEFILNALQPHFNRLLERDLAFAPVT